MQRPLPVQQVASALLVLTVTAVMVGISAWYLSGGRLLCVQTASMVPVFRPGDAVVVRRITPAALAVGEIVSYQRQPHGMVISHRIIAVHATTIVTKGDNVAQPDEAVLKTHIIGRAVAVAPNYGLVMNWLRKPWMLSIAVGLPTIAVLLRELSRYDERNSCVNYSARRSPS